MIGELISVILWPIILMILLIFLVIILYFFIVYAIKYTKKGELPNLERLFGSNKEAFSTSLQKSAENLKSAKTVQEIAASQINWLGSNYENVLRQSQRSFNFALMAAGISLVFFMFSINLLSQQQSQVTSAAVTALGGTLSGFVSAVNFYIYNKSTYQLREFHDRLDSTQRYLIADSICDKLDENNKNLVRADLIRTIAGIKLKENIIDPNPIEHPDNCGNKVPSSKST